MLVPKIFTMNQDNSKIIMMSFSERKESVCS